MWGMLRAQRKSKVTGRKPWTGWRLRISGVDAAIVVFNAVLIAVMWNAVVDVLRVDRQRTIDAAMLKNDNLATVLQQHALRTIETGDAVIHYLIREYARSGRALDVNQFMADYSVENRAFTGIVLADERGNVATTAYPGKTEKPVNVADREHFSVHIGRDNGLLFVGKPVIGRVTGKTVIPLTRRINKADGSFGGVGMVLIEPARFTNIFLDARLPPLDIISLAGLDGITRATLQGAVTSSGQDISKSRLFAARALRPDGNEVSRGGLDNVPRLFSYRTLHNYPVVAVVGTPEVDALADFSRRQSEYFWAAGLASALIAGVTVLLLLMLARQRRASASIAGSQARFLATFNQAAIGISHSDLEGRYTDVNQRVCDILGYTREELLGRSFTHVTHPHEIRESNERRRQAGAGGAGVQREKRYIRKDGSTVWCLVTSSVVNDAAGKPAYVASIMQDTSERKQAVDLLRDSEARLANAQRIAKTGAWELDLPGNQLHWSEQTFEIFGLETRAGIDYGAFLERVHPSDLGIIELARRSAQKDDPRLDIEYRITLPDGTAKVVHAAGELTRGPRGEPLRISGTITDITQRKQWEKDLRDHAEEMRSLALRLSEVEETERRNINRELHDRIGQNLAVLNLNLSMLRAAAVDGPPPLASGLSEAQALLETTIAQVRNVMADLRPPALDEYGLLAALRTGAESFAARTGLKITVLGEELEPRPALATETALFRIAQEAMTNAAKHAGAQHLDIALASRPGCIALSITDDGIGMKAGHPGTAGVSWGLKTMRERAEAIGATLRIDSTPQGTRIAIELSAAAA
jgi:PAS domain S-box-containing protein